MIDRDMRLMAYSALAAQWLSQTGGTFVTSELLGSELGINPTQVRRDLRGIVHGGKRGRGYDAILLGLGIDRELGDDRRDHAIERARNVQALTSLVTGHYA